MKKISDIENNLEKYLNENNHYGTFYVDDVLSEMARISAVPKTKYEIHIESGEGFIPHMHICKKDGNNIVMRICLLTNEYFREKDDKKRTLNTKERAALENYLNSDFSSEFGMSNWHHICLMWNNYNPGHQILNIKELKKPNYTTIIEPKK